MPKAIVTHDSYGYIDDNGLQVYAHRGDEIVVSAAELKRGQETGGLAANLAEADAANTPATPLAKLADVTDEPGRDEELLTPAREPVGKVERAGGSKKRS